MPTIETLITSFEMTDVLIDAGCSRDDYIVITMTRGWIMDELEARNPQAFGSWIDRGGERPREFFL